jgi:hypothetical protein
MLEKRIMRQIAMTLRHAEALGKTDRLWGTLWRACGETAVFCGCDDTRERIACCPRSHPGCVWHFIASPRSFLAEGRGRWVLARQSGSPPAAAFSGGYPGATGAGDRTQRCVEVAYDVNAFGQVTAIQHGVPSLVHSYAYNSLGNVDRYTDPMQRAQAFLPDALGRIVEHVRLGDGGAAIRNTSVFDDLGAPDGRTKVTRADDLGNLTIAHRDFAGRPFVVQNPGAGATAPTATSPHQSMSLYAQYDGASRLKTLFDGDQGRVEFWRDGGKRPTGLTAAA